MAALATQKPAVTGAPVTYVAAAGGGDSFVNNGREMVHIKNGSGASITATFPAGNSNANVCSFGVANSAHARVVTVGAGSDALVGPFDRDRHNDLSDQITCRITYSAVTSVTIAVIAAN